jgi:hypothetical protein
MGDKGRTEPPSSTDEDVAEYKRTLERVKRAGRTKTAELDDEKIGRKLAVVEKKLNGGRRKSPPPRSGTDG